MINPLAKTGSVILALTFICTLLVSAWSDAPGFVKFIAENKAFFTGFGAGILIAGFTRRLVIILLVIAAVFIVMKIYGGG